MAKTPSSKKTPSKTPSKEVKSTPKNAAKKTPKLEDKWTLIEKGEAKSAAQVHKTDPPVVQPKETPRNDEMKKNKRKRISDGLDVKERVLAYPPAKKVNNKKEKSFPKKRSINDETIDLTDSSIWEQFAMKTPKKDVEVKSSNKNSNKTKPKDKKKNKEEKTKIAAETVEMNESSSYIVEDPEDNTVTVVEDGKEVLTQKVVMEDDSDLSDEEFEDEFEDEEDEYDSDREREIQNALRNHAVLHVDSDEDEEEEDEEIDESLIDEEEMMIDPEDIEQFVNDEELDEEEMEDEEEDEEESVISDMDAESDEEGFIAGADREAIVINGKKKSNKGEADVDFDEFPFNQNDSRITASSAFAYMISSCDVHSFFNKFYQTNVLVVHRSQPNYYGNLFSTKRLVEMMEKNHLEYGLNVNIATYKNGIRKTMNGNGRVYPHIVKQHIDNGCSVQLVNPQTFDDRIWYFCEVLQELFGCFVGANTYLTPAGTSGFAPHWDDIDAFLLQVEGRKYWRVWAPERSDDELPLESSGNFTEEDMKNRKPSFEGWIEAGDVLYIPRGFIHQARTDKKKHSLHVTVSTGRHWSCADMLEKVIPEAIKSLATSRMKLRKALPIGLMEMGGVLDADYAQEEHFDEKFRIPVDRHMSMLRNLVADDVLHAAIDMMANEFLKQALPPMLTEEEKKYSVVGSGLDLMDGKLVEFNAKTKIRLIRKHTQRLVMQSEEECHLVHRMNNSRIYEGRPEQSVEYPVECTEVFVYLTNAYPDWCSLNKLLTSSETSHIPRDQQIGAVQLLFANGVLLVKN